MPYTETGKEKVKREAYYKANKDRGIAIEKQKDYARFGTTEQNIPQVNPMGDVAMPMSAGMKKGGKVMKNTKKSKRTLSKRGLTRTNDCVAHSTQQEPKPSVTQVRKMHLEMELICKQYRKGMRSNYDYEPYI